MLTWNIAPAVSPPPVPPQTTDPDFNDDGSVGFADFVLFAQQFGLREGDTGYDAKYDLDEDGAVGFGDFVIFANAFGKS